MLGWLVGQNIASLPVWDKSQRDDGTLSGAEFAFRALTCVRAASCFGPRGRSIIEGGRSPTDRSSPIARHPRKQTCCPNTPHRYIPRDSTKRRARWLAASTNTDAFAQSRRDRKKVGARQARHLVTTVLLKKERAHAAESGPGRRPRRAVRRTPRRAAADAGPALRLAGPAPQPPPRPIAAPLRPRERDRRGTTRRRAPPH
jgi:hypothetical protein